MLSKEGKKKKLVRRIENEEPDANWKLVAGVFLVCGLVSFVLWMIGKGGY